MRLFPRISFMCVLVLFAAVPGLLMGCSQSPSDIADVRNAPLGGEPPRQAAAQRAQEVVITSENDTEVYTLSLPSFSEQFDITFINRDTEAHRLVSEESSWDTGDLAPGATKSLSLTPGVQNYHCVLHSEEPGAQFTITAGAPAPEGEAPGTLDPAREPEEDEADEVGRP